MSEECVKTINIDKENIFVNPFTNIEPMEDSFAMYEKYLSCPANRKILERIGDNEIVSADYESFGTTRSEVLRRMACKYKLRSKLTTVRRNLIMNTSGVLVHQVDCEGKMDNDISKSIKRIYTEIIEVYNKLQVKLPGNIQLIEVVDGKHPLWICNLFGKENDDSPFGSFKCCTFLKKGLTKLRVQLRKKHMDHLPVYIPHNMGEFQGWKWEDYESIIQKYIPTAIICMK